MKRYLILFKRGIGDVLRATSLPALIKRHDPSAVVDVFVRTPITCDILRNDPNIDHIFLFDRNGSLKSRLDSIFKIVLGFYDVSISCYRNGIASHFLGALSKARKRIGYIRDTDPISRYFSKIILTDVLEGSDQKNEILNNLHLLDRLGMNFKEEDVKMVMHLSKNDEMFANDYLLCHQLQQYPILIGIAPGSSTGLNLKRWSAEKYGRLIDKLKDALNAEIIVFGFWGDHDSIRAIQENSRKGFLTLIDQPVSQAAALMKRCNVFVCNDNGGMHLAAAVGTPIVSIFGPTRRVTAEPLGVQFKIIQADDLECCPCWTPEDGLIVCRHREQAFCLKMIGDDVVADEVVRFVREINGEKTNVC